MARSNLKVLTLNCWALPSDYLPCKFRSERIAAIGKELATGTYDLVLLQEIWLQSDYEKLVNATMHVLKYSHYFHSGMFGSGLCIFSKHPIAETFQNRYSLNGYAHKVQHGDWFGGKAVGLAQILVDDFRINVYVTHTHADYTDIVHTLYSPQRVLQAYELSQFVKLTSQACDAVIVGGDFNFRPEDLGYKLVLSNGNLMDSWDCQTCKPKDEKEGCTSNVGNPDASKRIDFLLYRNNAGYDMVCDCCNVCLRQVPGQTYNFSDHLGVEATFQIRRNITGMAPERDYQSLKMQIPEAKKTLQKGIETVFWNRRAYFLLAAVCLVALLFTSSLQLPYGLNIILALYRVAACLLAGYALISAIILTRVELNGLISARNGLDRLLTGQEVMRC